MTSPAQTLPQLSVVIPVYNELATLAQIVERVLRVEAVKEAVVVDDGSTDGTRELLEELRGVYDSDRLVALFHDQNQGKGAAIRTGLDHVSGDVVVIQDADLEYHPEDYPAALKLIAEGHADAVYGSRFLGPHRVFLFWHYAGNRFLTLLSNVLFNTMLTDMETGFKMMRTEVLQSLRIRSFTFDFEVEVTAKLFKQRHRVYEMPITYTGRGYEEGKKITWKDGVRALWALVKFRLRD